MFSFMKSSPRPLLSESGKPVCSFKIHSFPLYSFVVIDASRAPHEALPLPSSFSKLLTVYGAFFIQY